IASLAEQGQQVPVIVVAKDERFVLIDGYLRVESLARLGQDTVIATAWALSEAEALLHHRHLLCGAISALEDAWLLARLRDQGLSLDELGRRLCRSKSRVPRRLALCRALTAVAQARGPARAIPPPRAPTSAACGASAWRSIRHTGAPTSPPPGAPPTRASPRCAPHSRSGPPMLDQSQRTTILTLHEAGHGSRAIARTLGLSRGAVKAVISDGRREPPPLPRSEKGEP